MNSRTDAAVGRAAIAMAMAMAAAILAGLTVPTAVLGQQPESVTVDVGACVNLQSPGERLDCYEEQVQRARSAGSPPSSASAGASTTAPVPAAVSPPARAPAAVRPNPAPAPAAAAPNRASAPAVVAPSPAPAPAAVAPRPTPSVQAGERAPRVEQARVPSGGGTSDELKLEGVITALRETVPNAWVITLDSGQVWRQTYPERYPLQVGKRVQISERRNFGSGYRLTVVGANGFIQVAPVR